MVFRKQPAGSERFGKHFFPQKLPALVDHYYFLNIYRYIHRYPLLCVCVCVCTRNQLRFALIEQGPLTSMSEADASPESVSLLSIKERHESTHSPTQVESKPPTG